MCTAATYRTNDSYFGRNLDLERSYHESVTITHRNFRLDFRREDPMDSHLAMIGMATVANGYPLYYDATNEMGLSMAGLNFPENAVYRPEVDGMDNIATFELIPWILGRCATVPEAQELMECMNILNESFSPELPVSPLHWMISDTERSVVVESVEDGLKIYENPYGVLTNNPPFPYHSMNVNNYMGLSRNQPENRFSKDIPMDRYSRGMGGIGMPGDLSSASRFVRAAFVRANSVSGFSESESVSQFMHILGSVSQQRGCVDVGGGAYEISIYTSCCNVNKGLYYYTTYENSRISCVDMYMEDLDGSELVSYGLVQGQDILYVNRR
ncbi:MAG: choloylglycine hydrolase [Candidatus Methanomethylophilaceae archaeon]|nr:choloylglycine hydrolase [Candidatus Methanomethylophilaceae archaeon]